MAMVAIKIRGTDELKKRIATMGQALSGDYSAQAGWYAEAGRYANGNSVVEVAKIHEYGATVVAPNPHDRLAPRDHKMIDIPARPFVRPAMAINRPKYAAFIMSRIKEALRGSGRIATAMSKLSRIIAGDLRNAILYPIVHWAPLSGKALKRRKYLWEHLGDGCGGALTKQLEDTHRMLNSIEARSFEI